MGTRRTRTGALVLLAGIVPLTVAACSAHGSASKSASIGTPTARSGSSYRSSSSPSTPSAPAGVDLAVAKRPASDRQVISTAQLDLQARNLDETINRASTLVVDAGGYVFSESASLTSAQHAHVVFKVPPERFADVIARIGRLGTLVHRNIGTQDVTGRVVDLNARLQAAQTSADRLRDLLASSGGVGDLLNVENQLTTRDAQVDTIAGELAAVRAQVDMATVTLDVTPAAKHAAAVPAKPRPGFARGLHAGSHAFAETARVTEAAVGVLLPFLPIALLALAGWWLVRRRGAANASTS
jgi:hypothetical protein